MGKVTGFLEYARETTPYRPVGERLQDWRQHVPRFAQVNWPSPSARLSPFGESFAAEA